MGKQEGGGVGRQQKVRKEVSGVCVCVCGGHVNFLLPSQSPGPGK